MSTHVLDVSREGIIRTLRDQFTSRFTFLSEALQNARRAGASAVFIEWQPDSGVLTIEDDGCGIADFDAVFTIGRSGWSAATIEKENPFGVGLMAAILASREMEIASHDVRVYFSTDALLRFEPVIKQPAPARRGVALRLTLNDELRNAGIDWQTALEPLVRGFPLPVFYQDVALPRPHSLDGGCTFHDCPVGRIALQGYADCHPIHWDAVPALYFQGLPVRVTDYRRRRDVGNVLHLDERAFRVRVPDRDVLIDEGAQVARIHEAVADIWRARLRERHASLPIEEFVAQHWPICGELKCDALIADAPLVASMVRLHAKPMPVRGETCGEEEEYAAWGGRAPPAREALFFDSEGVSYCGQGDEWQGPLASVYALKRDIPILHPRVPASHWARSREVDFSDGDVRVEYALVDEGRSMRFAGYFGECELKLCERYMVRCLPGSTGKLSPEVLSQLPPIEVDDVTFYDPVNERLIIPSKSAYPAGAIEQIFSYYDGDDHFLEAEFDEDIRQIASVIESLRSGSSIAYVNSLLASLWVDPEHVKDRTFQVHFDPRTERLVAVAP